MTLSLFSIFFSFILVWFDLDKTLFPTFFLSFMHLFMFYGVNMWQYAFFLLSFWWSKKIKQCKLIGDIHTYLVWCFLWARTSVWVCVCVWVQVGKISDAQPKIENLNSDEKLQLKCTTWSICFSISISSFSFSLSSIVFQKLTFLFSERTNYNQTLSITSRSTTKFDLNTRLSSDALSMHTNRFPKKTRKIHRT